MVVEPQSDQDGATRRNGLHAHQVVRAVHGDTVVLGKPDLTDGGYVLVYAREPPDSNATAAWTRVQLVQPLVANDLSTNTQFGSGLAIDGDQLVVGAQDYEVATDAEIAAAVDFKFTEYSDTRTQNYRQAGSVYIFKRQVPGDAFSNWTETAQITPAFETAPFTNHALRLMSSTQ